MNKPKKFVAKELKEFQEAFGTLEKIIQDKDRVILVFLTRTTIALPLDNKIMKILKKNIGKKIAILHTDNKDRPYLARDAEEVDEQ